MNDSPLHSCRRPASGQVLYKDDSQHCSYTSTKLISVFPCVLRTVLVLRAYRSTILMNTSQLLLSRIQARPGKTVKQDQEHICLANMYETFSGSSVKLPGTKLREQILQKQYLINFPQADVCCKCKLR